MENDIENNSYFIEKIKSKINRNKKTFIILLIGFTLLLIFISFFQFYQKNLNEKISEKFIKAGIFLKLKDQEKSLSLYKEIILSKNLFYSSLALNQIIENNLEENSQQILEFFDIVSNVTKKKEQKNLVKLKKALYYIKISKVDEGNMLLKEIISDESIWANVALDISKK
tara:strand:+ start:345 stop:854 length:510 start_codon:yes stop_codon:yes gene_type:complete